MRYIYYLFYMFIAVVSAPVAGLILAVWSLFSCTIAVVIGAHQGLSAAFFSKVEAKKLDMWEKHIERMKK